jgi:hypothetical protein
MDLSFIGLGRMGSAMARNISQAGHQVCAWNRTPVPDEVVSTIEIAPPGNAAVLRPEPPINRRVRIMAHGHGHRGRGRDEMGSSTGRQQLDRRPVVGRACPGECSSSASRPHRRSR